MVVGRESGALVSGSGQHHVLVRKVEEDWATEELVHKFLPDPYQLVVSLCLKA